MEDHDIMTVLDQIKGLSAAEALVAMEALWDRLSEKGAELESPDWHQEELARREAMVAEGKVEFIDWDEAKRRIRDRVK